MFALPRVGRPYVIDTDASAYHLGCTLLQRQEDPGSWHPVGYWSYALKECERNYSATERQCYAILWAITSLRPYIEGTHFTVRTNDDALRWIMTLTESSCRITRWRLRPAEFDFMIEYCPGRLHQVPDAPSRLFAPSKGNQSEIDDDVPTFDGDASLLTTIQDVSNELSDHRCTPKCDHDMETVVVTTRTGAISTKEAPGEATEPVIWLHEDDEYDELDDVDLGVFGPYDDQESLSRNHPNDKLPTLLSIEEVAEEQRADDFCQTILS